MEDWIHIESGVVEECAALILDRTKKRGNTQWLIPERLVNETEEFIGTRLTRLAMLRAGFRIADDDTLDWWSIAHDDKPLREIVGFYPVDLYTALKDLDVNGILARKLGLD